MDPHLAMAILSFAVVAIILIIALAVTGHFEPTQSLMDAADLGEKEFKDYVRRELHKAQVGAANTDPWASDLVDYWNKKHPNGAKK